MDYAIPASYEASRDEFRSWLPIIRQYWPDAELESYPLPGQDDLSIDWIAAGGRESREKMLIVTTGLHGIEGYAGALFLNLFIHEYLTRLDPKNTGILLVHSINAWGMKMRRRMNARNVDLNRNFVVGEFRRDYNQKYAELQDFIQPTGKIENFRLRQLRFLGELLSVMRRAGVKDMKAAFLNGQYAFPHGVYYGGTGYQPETELAMGLFRRYYRDYEHILHLDIHTGYGPRGRLIIVNSSQEARSSETLAHEFGYPIIAATNPEEFYVINGDMIEWIYNVMPRELPGKRFFATCFEYGTRGDDLLGQIGDMATTVIENQAYQHGASAAALRAIHKDYGELFLPTDPGWAVGILRDTRQALDGILRAEKFAA